MIPLLRLSLILVLMLTGIGLGAARGTVQIGGQVVICTGEGVVTRQIPGAPGPVAHVCPDMALALMAGVAPEQPQPMARRGTTDNQFTLGDDHGHSRPVPSSRARGPPAIAVPDDISLIL